MLVCNDLSDRPSARSVCNYRASRKTALRPTIEQHRHSNPIVNCVAEPCSSCDCLSAHVCNIIALLRGSTNQKWTEFCQLIPVNSLGFAPDADMDEYFLLDTRYVFSSLRDFHIVHRPVLAEVVSPLSHLNLFG